jgi:hypothetical protein
VASAVALFVVADGALATAAAGNDGNDLGITQRAAQVVGIVAFVGKQLAHAPARSRSAGAALMSLTLPAVSINA